MENILIVGLAETSSEYLSVIPKMGIIDPRMGISMNSRIGQALYGQTRQAVLRLFFSAPDRRFLQKEIIDRIGLGSGGVQRELERLSQADILARTVEGRQVYYQANLESPVFEELRSLIRKTFGVTEVLQEALEHLADRIDLAFVFGSVASGTEKSTSDVDLMIVSDRVSFDELVLAVGRAEKILGREVNPSLYTKRDFFEKLAQGHHFLSGVARGPKLSLIGDADELERLGKVAPPRQSKRGRRPLSHRRP